MADVSDYFRVVSVEGNVVHIELRAAAQTGEDDFRIVVKDFTEAREVIEELQQEL